MAESVRISAGKGIRVRKVRSGYILSARGGGQSFVHPFKVSLAGNGATVRPGRVNGVSATIQGTLLEGDERNPAPQLAWQNLRLDNSNRGWIAIEVACGEDWEIKTAEVVQVASLESLDGSAPANGTPGYNAGGSPGLPGRRARHPLAMLRQRKSGQVDLFQITHFDLQHRVFARDESTDIARHFFSQAG